MCRLQVCELEHADLLEKFGGDHDAGQARGGLEPDVVEPGRHAVHRVALPLRLAAGEQHHGGPVVRVDFVGRGGEFSPGGFDGLG